MEDLDPTLIKNDEDKKWIISRIDLYHKTLIDAIETMQTKYENVASQSSTETKDIRNIILTGFGIFLTIFLGYSSLYPYESWIFFIILIPVVIVALILFLIFNWLNSTVGKFMSDISIIIQNQEYYLQHSHGYVTTRVAFLDKISPEFLTNYYLFVAVLTNAVFASLASEYRRLAKEYSAMKDLKTPILNTAKEYENQLMYVKESYSKLDMSNLPPQLVTYVEKALKKYLK